MNKVLEYIIRAKDLTAVGATSAAGRIKTLAASVGRNLMNIQAGFQMASRTMGAAARGLWQTIKESFKFESLTVQFSVLMGSMEKAKQRMAELQEFAAETPFAMEESVKASRQLHVFSDGAMGASRSLRMVGDAAAAVGQNIQEVSFWVGRAYSMIKGGQPFGEAAMRLQEMGIVSPQVRQEMEDLQQAGASNAEVWAVLEKRLKEFNGGMETLSKTGDGLTSTLKDNWTMAVRTFGDAFADSAKGGIQDLIGKLDELQKSGQISVWADRAVRAMRAVRDSAAAVGKALHWIYTRSGASDIVGGVKGIARGAGAMAGGAGLREILGATDSGRAGGYWGGKLRRAMGDPHGGVAYNERQSAAQAEREAQIRAAAQKKHADKAQSASEKKNEDEKKRIIEDLAKAQKTVDEKRAKEAAEKEAAERAKLAVKEAAEREKAAIRLAEAEHRARLDNIRKEADVSAEAQVKASDRLTRAKSAAQQAWGWYRDPESFRAQLAEEKAEAEAQKQFAEDSDSLRRRTGWRSRELGSEQEAVRRVIFAREEEAKAREALVKIEHNTAGLKEMLETLLTAK